MAGSMEGKFLAEALKGNALNLEEANKKIENSTNPREKEKAFERAEKIETELKKIEEMMGIDAEEMLSLYKTITPEDARSIVTMTIAKIPVSLMKDALWTVDNLRECGGKIMLWASMKSTRDAAMVAAALMVLVSSGFAQKASANDSTPIEITHISETNQTTETVDVFGSNKAQDSLGDLEVVTVPEGIKNGGLIMSEDDGANHMETTYSNITVNGESTQKTKDGKYFNRHSIDEEGVQVGITNEK